MYNLKNSHTSEYSRAVRSNELDTHPEKVVDFFPKAAKFYFIRGWKLEEPVRRY